MTLKREVQLTVEVAGGGAELVTAAGWDVFTDTPTGPALTAGADGCCIAPGWVLRGKPAVAPIPP